MSRVMGWGTPRQGSGARERIAVCIKAHSSAQYLIARGFRMAQALDAELFVVYVETGEDGSATTERVVEESLQLAQNLGAQVLCIKANI